jgi:hypothetical protein
MDFPWDGILSRAKPAACAASPVDFVAREITRRNSYPGVWFGGSPSVIAPWSECDQHSAQLENRR